MLGILFMMSFVSLGVSTALYPVLTRVRVQREMEGRVEEVGPVVAVLLRYILLLLVPAAFIAGVNSYAFINVLFGPAYAEFPDAALSFSLLVFAYAAWGIVYALHSVLRSMGESRFFVVVGVGVIVFEIVVCWFLTGLLGLLGAAITRSVYVSFLLLASLLRAQQLGVRGLRSLAPDVLKISVAAAFGSLVCIFMAPTGLVTLGLGAAGSLAVYLLLLFASREIRPLDFRVVRHVLPVRLHGLVARIERAYLGTPSTG